MIRRSLEELIGFIVSSIALVAVLLDIKSVEFIAIFFLVGLFLVRLAWGKDKVHRPQKKR